VAPRSMDAVCADAFAETMMLNNMNSMALITCLLLYYCRKCKYGRR